MRFTIWEGGRVNKGWASLRRTECDPESMRLNQEATSLRTPSATGPLRRAVEPARAWGIVVQLEPR